MQKGSGEVVVMIATAAAVVAKWRAPSTSRRCLLTISSGKKEGINGVLSISNWLAVCFVAITPSEKPLLPRRRITSLTKRFYTPPRRVPFYLTRARKGEGPIRKRNRTLSVVVPAYLHRESI